MPPVSTTLAVLVVNLQPVSLILEANFFATGVVDTVVDTSGKFAAGVVDTGGAPCKYLRKFSKNFEMTLMLLSEAWWKMIHVVKIQNKYILFLVHVKRHS